MKPFHCTQFLTGRKNIRICLHSDLAYIIEPDIRELMKLSPDVIDYEKKGVQKQCLREKEEANAWEEDRNEIVIDDLLHLS